MLYVHYNGDFLVTLGGRFTAVDVDTDSDSDPDPDGWDDDCVS